MARRGIHSRARLCATAFALLLACEPQRSDDGPTPGAGASGAPAPLDAGQPDAASEGGRGAPAPLDSGRPFGIRPDAAFGLTQPTGPRSSARLVGWVVDVDGTAIEGAVAWAGGAVAISDAGGFVVIDEVYGASEADVTVRAARHASGHVRVPIRADETSYAVITLGPGGRRAIADVAAALPAVDPPPPLVDAGDAGEAADAGAPPAPPALQVELDAESLLAPWGAVASGPGVLEYAVLQGAAQAAAAPGSLLAVDAQGARTRLLARAAFEARFAQAGMQLQLGKPARFALTLLASEPLPVDAGAIERERLYWFDPQQGAFVERGEIEADGLERRGAIDRAGFWAIGRPGGNARAGCQRLRVQDGSGVPVPYAALSVRSRTDFDGAHLSAGSDGSACWEAAPATAVQVIAFGAGPSGFVTAASELSGDSVAAAGACGDEPDACSLAPPVVAQPLTQACVRGTLSLNFEGTGSWLAAQAGNDTVASGEIAVNAPFCISVPIGAELEFRAQYARCAAPAISSASVPGVCGVSDCTDVGTIECCSEIDACGGGVDDDCDGTADEGCECGGTYCETYIADACCTADQACAVRTPIGKSCFPVGQMGRIDPICPSEQVTAADGFTSTQPGCCRPDGQCGLWSNWGCILRSDAGEIWTVETPLAAMTCVF